MYNYRIATYKNGKLDSVIDCAEDYPTRERAIEAAKAAAEYWQVFTGGELQKDQTGAIRWFTDSEGNRIRKEYRLIENQ